MNENRSERKRQCVSPKFTELAQTFYFLNVEKQRNGRSPELEAALHELGLEIIFRYQQLKELVSLGEGYSVVVFKPLTSAVPLGFVAVDGYLIACHTIDRLERLILDSDEREDIQSVFRAHRSPY